MSEGKNDTTFGNEYRKQIEQLREENERLRARSWKISEDKRNIDMSRIEAEDALLYAGRDAQRLREENECLEAMKEGVEIRIADLNAETERLRELLEKAVVYYHSMPTTLVAAIKKEVGDEA